MADVPEEVCAFCKQGGEFVILQDTSDEILAHYYCLRFSPGVITRPQQDSQDNTVEFDIPSVISEINRGKKLRCSFCRKNGATVACNNNSCKKMYHCECLNQAGGVPIEDVVNKRYIALCPDHLGDIEGVQNTGQTSNEPVSLGDLPEDGAMLVEEITHTDEDTVLLSGQTLDESASSSNQEIGPMLVKEITPTDEDTVPLSDGQAKMNSRTNNKESYNESDSEKYGSSTEVKDQREFTRDEDPNGMEPESPEPSQTSNKVGKCTTEVEGELSKTSSLSVNCNIQESSRDDHNGMQSKLPESSLEGNRKEEGCRGADHDEIQWESFESTSESSRKKESSKGEHIDRMEMESPTASLISHSASRKSDLPENSSRRHKASEKFWFKAMKTNLRVLKTQQQTLLYQMKQQTKDGDAGFATNLIQLLRKVPEDKKLFTQISILNVLSSVLDQQPMSTSNPGCVPQQYTNPSSPRLCGQTPHET